MKKLFVLIFLTFSALFAQQPNFGNAMLYKEDINSQQAYEKQQNGAILIDVRTKREFEFLHPKDALNIPVFYEKFGQRVFNENFIEQVRYALNGNLDKEVILICRTGSRTKFASNLLANEGFSNVFNIQQGFIFDWNKQNLPVNR
jgi:rhodanese-related sulfurtransferase